MIVRLTDAGLPWVWAAAATLLVIAVVALVAVWFLHLGINAVSVRLLARGGPAETADLSQVEMERRVRTLEHIVTRIAVATITVIAVLMGLSQFDVDIGPAIAGLGVVGIAVGFGAQTLVRDWLAGVFVILENQYNQGDVVSIAGVSGVVEEFSLRRTVLRDLDGAVHTVPNGQIVVATNRTRVWARVNLDVQVAYDTDIDRATGVIDAVGEALHADPAWSDKLLEPPKVVRVDALGDSGVTLKVLGQVRAAEQWAVAGELRKRLLAAFAERGIEIPFPHRVMVTRGPRPATADAGTTAGAGASLDGGEGIPRDDGDDPGAQA